MWQDRRRRVHRGRIYPNSEVAIMDGPDGTPRRAKINQILEFEGLERKEVNEAQAGDIILVTGIEELNIGTTITDKDHPKRFRCSRLTNRPYDELPGEHFAARRP